MARTTVRKLYGSGAASADNVANLQIVRNGHIAAVLGAMNINSVTDNSTAFWELSFFPSGQQQTSDVAGTIFTFGSSTNFTTSGQTDGAVVESVSGLQIPVSAGVVVYANLRIPAGTITTQCNFTIYITER